MGIRIVTDSATDLPKSFVEENHIEVVPLKIQFGDEVFIEGINLSTQAFYDKMAKSEILPVTSLPSPQDFLDAFDRIHPDDEILCITISSAASGTYQSAVIAGSMTSHRIEIIDSLSISMGTGLMIMEACKMIQAGMPLSTIKESILAMRKEIKVYIAIDDLKNVIKGGRISNWKGGIAKILKIKPILTLQENGTIYSVDYIRGRHNQLQRLVEHVEASGKDLRQSMFVILHARADMGELHWLSDEIRGRFGPKEVYIGELGPTMGTHGGFGAIGIAF